MCKTLFVLQNEQVPDGLAHFSTKKSDKKSTGKLYGVRLWGELGGKKKPKTIKTCYLSFEKDTLGRSDLINTLFINYIHPISLKEQSEQEELQSPLAPSGGRPPPPLGFFTT